MKYKTKDNITSAIIHTYKKKTDEKLVLIALNVQNMRIHVKRIIKESLDKNKRVSWNVGKLNEVIMFKHTDYSNYDESDSEFIITSIYTIVKHSDGKTTTNIHHEKKRKNPKYEDKLSECGFCYEQVFKLYNQILLDSEKTPVKVCHKCKNELDDMRKIAQEIGIIN